MKALEEVFRKIISDLFTDKISEELLVAITYVLNLYDFYLSERCPLPDKKVELTRNTSIKIVSVFVKDSQKGESPHVWWKWRWHELMLKFHNEGVFSDLVENVVKRFPEHAWIDHIE